MSLIFFTLIINGKIYANNINDQYLEDPLNRPLIKVLNDQILLANQHALNALEDLNNEKNIKTHIIFLRKIINISSNQTNTTEEPSLLLIPVAKKSLTVIEKSNAPKHVISSAKNILRLLKSISDKTDMIVGGASPLAMGYFSEEIVKQFKYIIQGQDLDNNGVIADQINEGGLETIIAWSKNQL